MKLAESPGFIAEQVQKATERLEQISDSVADLDILDRPQARENAISAVSAYAKAVQCMQEIGAEVAQLAFDHGMTKKDIAAAWDIPASTFTGMQKRRS